MADHEEKYEQVFCIEHPKEVLQLFCVKCEDIICVSCNVENHNGHELSKLCTVKNILESKLKTTLKEDLSKLKTQFEETVTEVDRKLDVQSKEEMNTQNDMRETNIELKERIDEIEVASLKRLTELFEGRRNCLLKTKEQISKCQSLISETNEVNEPKENEIESKEVSKSKENEIESKEVSESNENKIESNDFDWIVKNYYALQQCTRKSRCVNMISDEVGITYIPPKLAERKGGQLMTESNENNTLICKNNDLVVTKITLNRCDRQNDSSKNNVNSSNDEFDFSSDVDIENEFPITLKLHGLKHQIQKIIPVSEKIIWMQVGNCLYQLDQEKVSAMNILDNVDDFTMMKDESLLLLNKSNQNITRRVRDGQTVKFTNVHPCSPLWLDVSLDKVAIVVTEKQNKLVQGRASSQSFNEYHIVIFCNRGIQLHRIRSVALPVLYHCILGIKLTKSSSLFFINKKTVDRRHLDTNENKRFSGIFGMNPANTFQTAGLTLGPTEETAIVTDESHPAILLLDDNLTFKRCLFDATNDLEKPTSIAWNKDRLWVVDGQKLLIFECIIENKK